MEVFSLLMLAALLDRGEVRSPFSDLVLRFMMGTDGGTRVLRPGVNAELRGGCANYRGSLRSRLQTSARQGWMLVVS